MNDETETGESTVRARRFLTRHRPWYGSGRHASVIVLLGLAFLGSLAAFIIGATQGHIVPGAAWFSIWSLVAWTIAFWQALKPGARVMVGQEGVYLRQFRRKPRFIRYDQLEAVAVSKMGVVLQCGDETIAVNEYRESLRQQLCQRINHAKEAWLERRRQCQPLAELTRTETDYHHWHQRLVSTGGQQDPYRRAGAGPEKLSQVLTDPAASPEQRVGAALALTARTDKADAKSRIRIAAEGCAHPKLRIALERAADGKLAQAALEEAEAALEDEAAPVQTAKR